MLIKVLKPLFVSYSSMGGFRKCPRYYYWKYIRRLEKATFKLPFIVGRIMHHGIQVLFERPDDAIEEIKKKFNEEAKEARKKFPEMSTFEEEDLAAQAYLTTGMLASFRLYFRKFLGATKHIATEKPLKYQLNKRVVVVGKIDNIIENQRLKWIYELKNLKSLDMDRVKAIKTDPQSALYLEVHNRQEPKKNRLDGIIYKIIRKPSIRKKKKESKREFMSRLGSWYQDQSDGLKFHLERIKGSFINGDAVINTVDKVSQQILDAGREKEAYFQDFSYCIHDWGKCAYYDLCHGDEQKNLPLFQIRKKYKVQDDEVAAVVED